MKKLKNFFLSPFLAIFAVWIYFSFPYFFQDRVPFPSLYQVNFFAPWNAYSEFSSPYKNGATPDVVGQIYPWRKFTIDTWKQGIIPLWNPYSFSGTFHMANYQSAVFSPINIGFFVFPFEEWWSVMILLQPLLAGIFTLLYVRTLRFDKFSQILSSVSFMFCGFIVTWMMYGTLGYAILFLPLALYSIEKYIQTKKFRYYFLLFITIPFSFFSGHFQISIYFLLFIIYYILIKYLYLKQRKILELFISIFLGLMVSSVQVFPSIEAYSQSLRSEIFQKIETIPWSYIPTFIAPDFYGNPVTRNAWFGHYAEWNAYIGIITLFFAFFALLKIKHKQIIIFLIPIFISLFLAFSTPLLDLLIFLKIPVISTSAASRIIVLFSFSAAILAGYGAMYLLEDMKKRNYKKIYLALGLFVLFFILLWGIVIIKLFFDPDKLQIAFSNLRLPSIIFTAFAVSLVILIFLKNEKAQKIILTCLILLVVFDLLRFSLKWQPFEPKGLIFKDTKISNFYKTLPQNHSRVFKNSGAEGIMYYNLQGVEGYDAVYIRRYGDFISSLKTGKLEQGARSVVSFPKDSPYATRAADFLGIRYFIHKISDGQNVWEFPFWKYSPESLNLLYDDGSYQILENPNAFPRVFLVKNVIYEVNSQKILDIMLNPNISLFENAIIEEDFDKKVKLGTGSAEILLYLPNKIKIETNSELDSFLVLVDSFAPGWNAYVNGKKTHIYRTDFTFRGIFIPSGKNEVVFIYEPESFRYGIGAFVFGMTGILTIALKRRKEF